MTELFKDGFDHYGSGATGLANMLSGTWASVPSSLAAKIDTPSWGSRTGPYAIFNHTDSGGFRHVLSATKSALVVAMGFSCEVLPPVNNRVVPVYFRDSGNNGLFKLVLQSNGALELQDSGGTVLAATQGPVIVASTWQFVEMKIDITAQTFELYVDNVVTPVIDATGLDLGATDFGQISFLITTPGDSTSHGWIDDLIVRDTGGTRNNDFEGDLRVATLFPNADTEVAGWTPRPRKKFGTGILDNRSASNSCVTAASSTQTDLGSDDFTVEQFVRFYALPTGSNKACLFGKWDETNNRRSYQLYVGGPDLENGNIVFRISTDGQADTVQELFSWPWAPDLDVWYHVAISRASGETMLFINGVQQGLPVADANTYFAGAAPTAIGARCEGTSSATVNTAFTGFMDEVRLTVGLARYNGPFTPPATAFGRNGVDDPDFAHVALLCGFDSGIADESSYGRLLTARNGAVQHTPDDGVFAFQTIDQHTPRDDTFVEAALVPAEGIYTLVDVPTDGKTVTVGTTDGATPAVYTYKDAIASAFDVLIGADADATLANLVEAINAGTGEGVKYGTGTTANADVTAEALPVEQIKVTAITPGTGGNAIGSTTDEPNGSWDSATLSGGADIPGPSEFMFDRPPAETTVIKSVTIVTRNFKSDAGTCTMQASLVGPHGAATDGADNAVGVNPSYYQDIFETDPDTGEDLTPTTIVSGRVRLNRTS